jgi:hypothetical protein
MRCPGCGKDIKIPGKLKTALILDLLLLGMISFVSYDFGSLSEEFECKECEKKLEVKASLLLKFILLFVTVAGLLFIFDQKWIFIFKIASTLIFLTLLLWVYATVSVTCFGIHLKPQGK